MFNPLAYENSRGDGVAVLEVIDAEGDEKTTQPVFVPLRRSVLTGVITGPLADLGLTHVFAYDSAVCNRVLEAAYRFPLPGDAAVRSVTVRFGQTVIAAALKGREEAEREYEQARRENRQAALATREAANVFTLLVTGLQPDEEIVVETRYVQLARTEGLKWSLRIPLTTAPRYVRRDEQKQRQADGQPLAVLRDPGHRFALDVEVIGPVTVASPTHPLALETTRDGVRVQLRDGDVMPDRDCVVVWRPEQAADQPALQVLVHDDPASDALYFLAYVVPPAAAAPEKLAPREVTLLVDHSGSMRGPKWEAADWAVNRFASDLSTQDFLGLGTFHNVTRWYRRQLVRAEPANMDQALKWLESSQDSGGTELGAALEQALTIEPAVGDHSRHVLVITDAEVTDSGRILRLADQEAAMVRRRRISVLCIDAAPNAYLAQALAERGGGIARFLTSAPDQEDISTALDDVLGAWTAPVLTGLRLEINRMGNQAAGRTVTRRDGDDWEAIDLGDLPSGCGVWVAGRAPRRGSSDLEMRVQADGGAVLAVSQLTAGDFPVVKACFGVRRVNALEHLAAARYTSAELAEQLERLGYDAQVALAGTGRQVVYAENTGQEAAEALRQLLMREALAYGVLSSETAFVATREEAGRPVEGSVPVANALPAGWSEAFVTAGLAAPASPAMRSMMFDSGGLARVAMSALTEASALISEVSSPTRKGRDAGARESRDRRVQVFNGVPAAGGADAVLYDSARSDIKLPDNVTLSALSLVQRSGQATSPGMDGQVTLLLFVGDLAQPRAKIRFLDMIRQVRRPLNIARQGNEPVRLVLHDPHGTLAASGLHLELWIRW